MGICWNITEYDVGVKISGNMSVGVCWNILGIYDNMQTMLECVGISENMSVGICGNM